MISQQELDECKKKINDLLSKGWPKPSISQYNHSILFARKKDGTLRIRIDYHSINNNTVVNEYSMPRINNILDCLGVSMPT